MSAERPSPQINPDSMISKIMDGRTKARIGFTRRRMIAVGGIEPDDHSYVQLGTRTQLTGFLQIDQDAGSHARESLGSMVKNGTRRIESKIARAFDLRDTFEALPIIDAEDEDEALVPDEIRHFFIDGDQIVEGPAVAPSRPEEAPILLPELFGLWVPMIVAFGDEWLISPDQR